MRAETFLFVIKFCCAFWVLEILAAAVKLISTKQNNKVQQASGKRFQYPPSICLPQRCGTFAEQKQ